MGKNGFLTEERTLALLITFLSVIATCVLAPTRASAGTFEYSAGFFFNKTTYSNTDFDWVRRWGTSLGYHFTESSELEFSFQDVTERTKLSGYEDTKFHDQIYSVDWIQSFAPKDFPLQPYVKFGVGQLNRNASGSYADGQAPPTVVDTVTVVLGGGLKIFFTRNFAIRSEVTSYLTDGKLGSWKDNIGLTLGLSVFF